MLVFDHDITVIVECCTNAHKTIIVLVVRKSLEEHQSAVDDMNEEEKGFEITVAKSLVEIQKLEAQKQSQQQLLAEHFKNTMAISDATFGNRTRRYHKKCKLTRHKQDEIYSFATIIGNKHL